MSDKYELGAVRKADDPVVPRVPLGRGAWVRVLLLARAGRVGSYEEKKRGLAVLVRAEFEASDRAYGYRRVAAALGRKGVSACQDTVRAVMREQSLKGRATAPERPRATASGPTTWVSRPWPRAP